MYKKILLAIDGSSNSERALRKVIELQKNGNSKVVMIHSIKYSKNLLLPPIGLASGYGSYYISEPEILEESKRESEKLLFSMQELFKKENLPVETRVILDEHPEDYIKRIVKQEHFDLVVIGTKGIHSKRNQLIIGSIAQKVVKHVVCDILIIR
ncbi:MAG: universal stress protein [Candidatus Lokiarchaeota archaeon]|nr:universal stress protein [Candidatus Lokiarchaeota archaeon]